MKAFCLELEMKPATNIYVETDLNVFSAIETSRIPGENAMDAALRTDSYWLNGCATLFDLKRKADYIPYPPIKSEVYGQKVMTFNCYCFPVFLCFPSCFEMFSSLNLYIRLQTAMKPLLIQLQGFMLIAWNGGRDKLNKEKLNKKKRVRSTLRFGYKLYK